MRKTFGSEDHHLVAAVQTSRVSDFEAQGRRTYLATFSDGTTLTFAVGHAQAAGVYAREYAARIIGNGVTVVNTRWNR